MSDPIVAWRYWWIPVPRFDFDAGDWEGALQGDREVWDGPLKQARTHAMDPGDHLIRNIQRLSGYGDDAVLPAEHRSPERGCLCGVNAVRRLRSRDHTERYTRCTGRKSKWNSAGSRGWRGGLAFAQVDLGGKVDEYEEGYRAEYALIAGPIYVVRPPQVGSGLDWRTLIERRYGQPVIEQTFEEALDWIRKDEEANGHREAHQDARAGTLAGTGVSRTVATAFYGTRSGITAAVDPASRAGDAQWAALYGAGLGAVNTLAALGTGEGTRPRLTARVKRWWRYNGDAVGLAVGAFLALVGLVTVLFLVTGIATVRVVP